MSAPRHLDDLLRAARPADPSGDDLDAATVRVMARVEMLQAGAPRRRRRVHAILLRLTKVAAVLGLAFLATQTVPALVVAPSPDAPPVAVAVPPAPPAPPSWVLQALAGDPLARQMVIRGGPSTRLTLLDYAASSPTRASETLSLLRAAGGVRDDVEAARVRHLAERPALRSAAIDLLARSPSTAGVRHLGRLLVEVPDAEASAVEALIHAARRGRRTSALRALLDGAAAGRMLAAAEAMRLVQGRSFDTLLDGLPEDELADARLVVAVRDAPATTRDRLLRRAARGDEPALRLAVEARLAGVVPLLADRVHDEDVHVATVAVTDLVRQHRPEAWYQVARATGGPAAETARRALRDAPPSALVDLERTAREVPRRRRVAVAGLASAGPDGFLALERLAERPALRAAVIDAAEEAEEAEGDEAVDLLLELAASGRAADRAVLALGRRVGRGDVRAGRALLALVREHSSRQALRVLCRHGAELGVAWLEQAATDMSLPPGARVLLMRAWRRAREAGGAGEAATPRRGDTSSPIT